MPELFSFFWRILFGFVLLLLPLRLVLLAAVVAVASSLSFWTVRVMDRPTCRTNDLDRLRCFRTSGATITGSTNGCSVVVPTEEAFVVESAVLLLVVVAAAAAADDMAA